MTAEVKR